MKYARLPEFELFLNEKVAYNNHSETKLASEDKENFMKDF